MESGLDASTEGNGLSMATPGATSTQEKFLGASSGGVTHPAIPFTGQRHPFSSSCGSTQGSPGHILPTGR